MADEAPQLFDYDDQFTYVPDKNAVTLNTGDSPPELGDGLARVSIAEPDAMGEFLGNAVEAVVTGVGAVVEAIVNQ